ncbi:hypothetical protein APU90_06770 [Rathayibacter toxicus]|uniref:Uncharacterized protein n=1 Tax=Rathayibacter toxicus TaxID=145458 RepID=A0A0C5BFQ7_9MICO|nr:hypothetical protein TI83_10295 [Rathayibacter toxicus]ALS57505.1 hypothetical protein APU90_06770 [Rathayibacter toxicus]KKM46791.1 hypothetical protein VT73_01935 [Rathayibacter toxicus]
MFHGNAVVFEECVRSGPGPGSGLFLLVGEDLRVIGMSVVTHFDTGGFRCLSSRHTDHNLPRNYT